MDILIYCEVLKILFLKVVMEWYIKYMYINQIHKQSLFFMTIKKKLI